MFVYKTNYDTINTLVMRIFLLFALLLTAPLTLLAQPGGADPVTVELLTSHQEIDAGSDLDIAISFRVEKGWHTYWKNPGDAGAPISLTWQLPEGFTVSDISWPAPKAFEEQGVTIYGYDQDFALLAKIHVPESFKAESFDIKAVALWVACNEFCLPGKKVLQQSVFVGRLKENESVKDVIQSAKGALPQSIENLSLVEESDRLVFTAPLDALSGRFFPDSVDDIKADVSITDGKIIVVSGVEGPLNGVLQIDSGNGVAYYDLHHTPAKPKNNLLWVLLAAFGGGLILNLMPCVFPVLSLKVLSVIEAATHSTSKRAAQALSYGAGVLLSFLGISGLLLLLRASGGQIGWGFQLQEPLFVAFLCGLFFLMGLNLFGLFEMGTSLCSLENKHKKEGMLGSFFSGVLATIVATPCTGPLLGSTLGLTLTLPAEQSLLIFAVMGIGLALPFMVLMLCPPLARLLPRPGPWMLRLKQAMGFLMMAAVLWLIWVFEAETDFTTVLWLLGALLVLSVAGWIWGTWGELSRRRSVRFVAFILAMMLAGSVSFAIVSVVKTLPGDPGQTVIVESDDWQAFSPDLLEKLIAEKKPVFVDFTAKWCLICQANKAVLHSAEVEKAFKDKDVVKLKADWTKGDPVITEYLKKYQRSGVPLYIYYNGEKEPPTIFPETLTPSLVINALY